MPADSVDFGAQYFSDGRTFQYRAKRTTCACNQNHPTGTLQRLVHPVTQYHLDAGVATRAHDREKLERIFKPVMGA